MDFDIAAKNWDNDERVSRAKLIANEILKEIDIKEQCNALEFGCGTGLISFNLFDKFESIELVDTSKGMIEELNSKIEKLGIKNMVGNHIGKNNNQYKKNKYDVIYMSMVLHHIVEFKNTIEDLHKCLKEDGYLCIVDLNEEDGSFHREDKDFKGHNGFKQEILISAFEEIGFEAVKINTFYSDKKIVEGENIDYTLFLLVGRKGHN